MDRQIYLWENYQIEFGNSGKRFKKGCPIITCWFLRVAANNIPYKTGGLV